MAKRWEDYSQSIGQRQSHKTCNTNTTHTARYRIWYCFPKMGYKGRMMRLVAMLSKDALQAVTVHLLILSSGSAVFQICGRSRAGNMALSMRSWAFIRCFFFRYLAAFYVWLWLYLYLRSRQFAMKITLKRIPISRRRQFLQKKWGPKDYSQTQLGYCIQMSASSTGRPQMIQIGARIGRCQLRFTTRW